ncbi:unnamed protein product [Rotaria socialis]|uniref:Glutamate--cysteine ligase modifier subunit n=1 Tax=Rotaria socialis TaxID=392032 RepID=A0A820HWU2_9BILA|nr:unnamed protein product [Rotaria socialis]
MSAESQDDTQSKSEVILKPFFPKATEILFYTGNTLALFKVLKKTNSTITDEVIEYMSMILQTIRTNMDIKQHQEDRYVKLISVQDDENSTASSGATPGVSIDNEQLTREDMKFSVKVFLRSLEPEILTHTINAGLSHKPYANQINLGVCCSIPEELNKYVKENNIQLLTHSDPIDVINESEFQQTISEYCHEYDSLNWKPCSVVRYNSVIANRGIIKSKGFLIYAKRELRMA